MPLTLSRSIKESFNFSDSRGNPLINGCSEEEEEELLEEMTYSSHSSSCCTRKSDHDEVHDNKNQNMNLLKKQQQEEKPPPSLLDKIAAGTEHVIYKSVSVSSDSDYHDSLMQFDLNFSTEALNLLPVHSKTRKKMFCCFCPTIEESSNDSRSDECDDDANYLDSALDCYTESHDVDIFLDADDMQTLDLSYLDERDNGERLLVISFDDRDLEYDEASAYSSINEDEFLSCCDSSDFTVNALGQQCRSTRSASIKKKVAVPPFSRFLRICDFDIYILQKDRRLSLSEIDNATDETTDLGLSSSTTSSDRNESIEKGNIDSKALICPSPNLMSQATKLKFLELTNRYNEKSREVDYHLTVIQAINTMVKVALNLASGGIDDDQNPVTWKVEGSTVKTMTNMKLRDETTKWYENKDTIKLLEKEVLLWSGCPRNSSTPSATNYGSKLPLFKARGIIPGISPLALTQLILDSTKVKLYNKFANNRKDLHVFQSDLNIVDGLFGDGSLKIVQTETSIPICNKTINVVNFLHARPIKLHHDDLRYNGSNEDSSEDSRNYAENLNAYIIVSRSIYSNEEMTEVQKSNSSKASPGSRNEVIWGVNILREVPGYPNKTDLTTLNQADSSSVPSFLSHKVS